MSRGLGLGRYLASVSPFLVLWFATGAAQTVVRNTTILSPLFGCTNETRLPFLTFYYCSVTETTIATGVNRTCRLGCGLMPCSTARLTAPMSLLQPIKFLFCQPGPITPIGATGTPSPIVIATPTATAPPMATPTTTPSGTTTPTTTTTPSATPSATPAATATPTATPSATPSPTPAPLVIGTVPPAGTTVSASIGAGVLVGGVVVQAPGNGQAVALPAVGSITIPGAGGVTVSFGPAPQGIVGGRRRLQQATRVDFAQGAYLANENAEDGALIGNGIYDPNIGYVSPGNSVTNLLLYSNAVYPGIDPPVSVVYTNITFPQNVTVQNVFLGNPTVGKGLASDSPANMTGVIMLCFSGPTDDVSTAISFAYYQGYRPGAGISASFVPATGPNGEGDEEPVLTGGIRASNGACKGARLLVLGSLGNFFTATGQGSALSIGTINYTIDL